jgi:hypothetical protein
MWTDGADQPADLAHVLAVRRVALDHFGPNILHAGQPLSDLRRWFAPIWLFHRYEVAAIGKIVGGLDYRYAVVGGATPSPSPAAADEQRAALTALLSTLSAKELTVPPALALLLSSGVNGRSDPQFDSEVFDTAGAAVFDPLVATDLAAQVTLDSLFAPSRLARVYIQQSQAPKQLGLGELLDRLTAAVIDKRGDAVERRIATRTIIAMARAWRNPATSIDVAAVLDGRLRMLADRFALAKGSGDDAMLCRSMAALLRDGVALDREIGKTARPAPAIPPGMPIGGEANWFGG